MRVSQPLDYGLARTATSHWASGDTANAEAFAGARSTPAYVFPAAHFEAFVLGDEGAKDPAALDTVIRSRMIAMWGFGTMYGKLGERVSLFPPELKAALKRNIQIYKQYRHLLREDVYHLLPPSTNSREWDAIEFCKRDGSEAVVLAFRSQSAEAEKVLRSSRAGARLRIRRAELRQRQAAHGDRQGTRGGDQAQLARRQYLGHRPSQETIELRGMATTNRCLVAATESLVIMVWRASGTPRSLLWLAS